MLREYTEAGSVETTGNNAADFSNSRELNSYDRPVVLGLFDYLPWYINGEESIAQKIAETNKLQTDLSLRNLGRVIKPMREEITKIEKRPEEVRTLLKYQAALDAFNVTLLIFIVHCKN